MRKPKPDYSAETIKAMSREVSETHRHLDDLIASAEAVHNMIFTHDDTDEARYVAFMDAIAKAKAFMKGDIL